MKLVVAVWSIGLVVNLFLTLTSLFTRERNKIQFGRWARFFPLNATVLITMLFVDTYPPDSWAAFVVILCIFGYSTYAANMFGYVYDDGTFSWFNGLRRRSVLASSIRIIVWLRDKNRIAKVRFECEDRSVDMRIDLKDAVSILKNMATDHGIETRSETLPRWSI